MDVKFVTVRSSTLNSVPVVDGQLIALEDLNGLYYDMNSVRYRVSGVRVASSVSGTGQDNEICVVPEGENQGVYVWDSVSKSYVLVANKDTDTYLSIVKSTSLANVFPVATDGSEESRMLYWNDLVSMNVAEGTISAKEFLGKSTSSYLADKSTYAADSDHANSADVAEKIGSETVGSLTKPVYVSNGTPTECLHSVESNVPENAQFTDTTYAAFEGSTESSDGSEGLVPKPVQGQQEKFLKADGTWSDVNVETMTGCTSDLDGSKGLVPAPAKGKYNSFLKGDGTWASYSAGSGLDLVSLTFNLSDSGVQAGTYGPTPNAEEMTSYVGDYVLVPRITVDKYGRVTSVQEVKCYLTGSSPAPEPDPSLMTFSNTPDNERLLVTYDNLATALAEFDINSEDHLTATYNYDPTPMTLEVNEDGHCIATPTDSSSAESVDQDES